MKKEGNNKLRLLGIGPFEIKKRLLKIEMAERKKNEIIKMDKEIKILQNLTDKMENILENKSRNPNNTLCLKYKEIQPLMEDPNKTFLTMKYKDIDKAKITFIKKIPKILENNS